jgi:hypothetical protein
MMSDDRPLLTAAEKRALLEKISKLLTNTLTSIRKLPRRMQRDFLPSQTFQGPLPYSLIRDTEREEATLSRFLKDVEIAAKRANQQSRRIRVTRAGGQPNYLKKNAAFYAHLLLTQYGKTPPTLTTGGPFFELASLLYEAATGQIDVDLSNHCRKTRGEWSAVKQNNN